MGRSLYAICVIAFIGYVVNITDAEAFVAQEIAEEVGFIAKMQKYSDIPSKLTHKSALRILKYQRLTVEVQKKLEAAVVLDEGLAEFKANLRSINLAKKELLCKYFVNSDNEIVEGPEDLVIMIKATQVLRSKLEEILHTKINETNEGLRIRSTTWAWSEDRLYVKDTDEWTNNNEEINEIARSITNLTITDDNKDKDLLERILDLVAKQLESLKVIYPANNVVAYNKINTLIYDKVIKLHLTNYRGELATFRVHFPRAMAVNLNNCDDMKSLATVTSGIFQIQFGGWPVSDARQQDLAALTHNFKCDKQVKQVWEGLPFDVITSWEDLEEYSAIRLASDKVSVEFNKATKEKKISGSDWHSLEPLIEGKEKPGHLIIDASDWKELDELFAYLLITKTLTNLTIYTTDEVISNSLRRALWDPEDNSMNFSIYLMEAGGKQQITSFECLKKDGFVHIGAWDTVTEVFHYMGGARAVSLVIDENKSEAEVNETIDMLQIASLDYLKLISQETLFLTPDILSLTCSTGIHIVRNEAEFLYKTGHIVVGAGKMSTNGIAMDRVELYIKSIEDLSALAIVFFAVPENITNVYIEFQKRLGDDLWEKLLNSMKKWKNLIHLELAGKVEPFFEYCRRKEEKLNFVMPNLRFSSDSAIVDHGAFGYVVKLFQLVRTVVPVSVGGNLLEDDVEKLRIALQENLGANKDGGEWERKMGLEDRLNGVFMLMHSQRFELNERLEENFRQHSLAPPSLKSMFDNKVQSSVNTDKKLEV